MNKKLVAAIIMVMFSFGLFVSVGSAQLKQLQQVPDFTLVSTDEDTITLSEQQGKIVVLHFWKNN